MCNDLRAVINIALTGRQQKQLSRDTGSSDGCRVHLGDEVAGEIAGAVLGVCSDGASFMTGEEMVIGGGQAIHSRQLLVLDIPTPS